MGYKVSRGITFEEAESEMKNYEYALVFSMSKRELFPAKDIELNKDELLEARFFSYNGELHIYRDGDDLKAVKVTDCDEPDAVGAERDCDDKKPQFVKAVKKRYALDGNSCKNVNGTYLIVCEYLTADADGQVSVSLTRLAGIE